ncbi:hypothetical protein BHE74_00053006 [Ensete ventricosum]|nr:hypothetical protein BHE74_00053006 [Ensete ventricosum]
MAEGWVRAIADELGLSRAKTSSSGKELQWGIDDDICCPACKEPLAEVACSRVGGAALVLRDSAEVSAMERGAAAGWTQVRSKGSPQEKESGGTEISSIIEESSRGDPPRGVVALWDLLH